MGAFASATDIRAKSTFVRIGRTFNVPFGCHWLVVAAAVLNLVASRRKQISQTQTASQAVASAAIVPAAASPIDVEAFFRHTYSGQLQVETERNVRAMIQSRPQENVRNSLSGL